MYRLGTSEDLWACSERYPEIFHVAFEHHSLKPLGHATVCEYIRREFIIADKNYSVLEIGHGASSPFFAIFGSSDKIHCYGIDDNDKDNTVSISALNKLRGSYPNVTFYSGYLGENSSNNLPSNFFDLVFSVSVVEHIPEEQLQSFHKEVLRILKPNGLQIHSYDRPWGGDVKLMKRTIENVGFEWLEAPKPDNDEFWCLETRELARIVFEHPYNVMDSTLYKLPSIMLHSRPHPVAC